MSIAHEGEHSRLTFDMSDRLAKALKVAAITSNAMAEHLGVSRTTISSYINGRTTPNRSQRRDWALRTGVPLEWLETGAENRVTPDDGGSTAVTGLYERKPHNTGATITQLVPRLSNTRLDQEAA